MYMYINLINPLHTALRDTTLVVSYIGNISKNSGSIDWKLFRRC